MLLDRPKYLKNVSLLYYLTSKVAHRLKNLLRTYLESLICYVLERLICGFVCFTVLAYCTWEVDSRARCYICPIVDCNIILCTG